MHIAWQSGSKHAAREKLRQFQPARCHGDESPGPARTQLTDILDRYAQHVRTTKTAKSAWTDIAFLTRGCLIPEALLSYVPWPRLAQNEGMSCTRATIKFHTWTDGDQ